MSLCLDCKVPLDTGDQLTVPSTKQGHHLRVEAFLGKGAFKRVFIASDSHSETLVAISCTRENVDEANCIIKKLHKLIGKTGLFCLPSPFQCTSLKHKGGEEISKPLFFQTSPLFHSDLHKLIEALNQADSASLKHGFVDFNDQQIDRETVVKAFIDNANKVNTCLFGPQGICHHLKAAKIRHGDFRAQNIFININPHLPILIAKLTLADWDGTQLKATGFSDDVFSASMVFSNMPMSSASSSFKKAFENGTLKKPLTDKQAYLAGIDATAQAKRELTA